MGRNRKKRKLDQSSSELPDLSQLDHSTLQQLDDYFNRKYSYPKQSFTEKWSPPGHIFTGEHWNDPELEKIKSKLNQVKCKLSSVDINAWQDHTQALHKGNGIIDYVKKNVKAELCTQAWCKFHEVLGAFPIVPRDLAGSFNSIHLCEAPGAFIASLNHYLVSRKLKHSWNWVASTLNPYYEGNDLFSMIDNDTFIFKTLPHWCFGADDTGDIMNEANITALKHFSLQHELHNFNLVTCDGSIDCANSPGDQEKRVCRLHYSEVVATLDLLAVGGHLVLKMFTMLEDSSICLMWLLFSLFAQVNVFKPVSSKPGNSEVYVVAQNFSGISSMFLEQLKKHVGLDVVEDKPLFNQESIPELFLQSHRECCRRFSEWQLQAIQSNMELFGNMSDDMFSELRRLKSCFIKSFLDRYNVHRISFSDFISPVFYSSRSNDLNHSHPKRRYTGTLAERQTCMQLSWQQKVQTMEQFAVDDIDPFTSFKGVGHPASIDITNWSLVFGRQLQKLHSSKFCNKKILSQYLDLHEGIKTFPGDPNVNIEFYSEILNKFCGIDQISSIYILNDSILKNVSDGILEIGSSHLEIITFNESAVISTGAMFCGHLPRRYANDMESILSNTETLKDFIDMLLILPIGCHCTLSLGPMLTRRSSGVLFLFYSLFSKVAVIREGHLNVQHLAGFDFVGCSADVMNYLKEVKLNLSKAAATDGSQQELLSFVPIEQLLESKFHLFLCSINDSFLKLRINFLLEYQKRLVSPVD